MNWAVLPFIGYTYYTAVMTLVSVCSQQPLTEDLVLAERQLSEQRPNVTNRQDLLRLMDATRKGRRQWISKECPSITQILHRYPRFVDINETVFFTSLMKCCVVSVSVHAVNFHFSQQ